MTGIALVVVQLHALLALLTFSPYSCCYVARLTVLEHLVRHHGSHSRLFVYCWSVVEDVIVHEKLYCEPYGRGLGHSKKGFYLNITVI